MEVNIKIYNNYYCDEYSSLINLNNCFLLVHSRNTTTEKINITLN